LLTTINSLHVEFLIFRDKVDVLLCSLGLPFGMGVGSYGRGGGLPLQWNRELKVKLASCDKLHFDVVLLDPESNVELWHLTGFYNESCRDLGYRSWDLLNS